MENDKPFIKLDTLWMLDLEYDCGIMPESSMITKGLWMTKGVEVKDNGRIYDLFCVSSDHPDIKVGDKRRMHEFILIYFCHQVELVHLPKLEIPLKYQQNETSKSDNSKSN
jgi:hypothetical protein